MILLPAWRPKGAGGKNPLADYRLPEGNGRDISIPTRREGEKANEKNYKQLIMALIEQTDNEEGIELVYRFAAGILTDGSRAGLPGAGNEDRRRGR